MANVLVVDDDLMVRRVVAMALTKQGHAVREAGNGVEGLRLIRVQRPDLIVSDIVMPNADGIELLIALRKAGELPPLIAMSGYSTLSPLYLHTARQLGALRTLSKPFTIAALLEAVKQALPPALAIGAP